MHLKEQKKLLLSRGETSEGGFLGGTRLCVPIAEPLRESAARAGLVECPPFADRSGVAVPLNLGPDIAPRVGARGLSAGVKDRRRHVVRVCEIVVRAVLFGGGDKRLVAVEVSILHHPLVDTAALWLRGCFSGTGTADCAKSRMDEEGRCSAVRACKSAL
jgi:hypothetical protein